MENLDLAGAFGAADSAEEQDLRGYYPMAARVLAEEVRLRAYGAEAERNRLREEIKRLRAEYDSAMELLRATRESS